jgi:hypothetical protein
MQQLGTGHGQGAGTACPDPAEEDGRVPNTEQHKQTPAERGSMVAPHGEDGGRDGS